MALTLDQWYSKLSKFVPRWWFEDAEAAECFTVAVFYATASIMQQIQQDSDDQFNVTFITRSTAPIEDLLGDERNIARISGESDAAYAVRIQQLFGVSEESNLQAVIDGALNNGPAFLIENEAYGFYDDPDLTETNGIPYYDDYWTRWLDAAKWYNWFTVIIPEQTGGVQSTIQTAIITNIEANKAFGVSYDVLYETTNYMTDEAGDIITDESGNPIVQEQS